VKCEQFEQAPFTMWLIKPYVIVVTNFVKFHQIQMMNGN